MEDRQDLEDMVREFVADAADICVADVGLDDDLYNDLGVDSLGSAMIFIYLIDTFGVQEPQSDEEYAKLNTPRKLADYVLALPP